VTIGTEMTNISLKAHAPYMRYEVLRAVSIRITVLWDVAPRRSVETFRKKLLLPSETQKTLFCRVASGNRFLRNTDADLLSSEPHVLHTRSSDYSLLST
jgi:hypothetical protein